MKQDRFIQILEAYGSDSNRWPELEREAACLFADTHSELVQDAVAAEQELDAFLGAVDKRPSDILNQRILKFAPTPKTIPVWYAPLSAAAAAIIITFAMVVSDDVTLNQEYDDLELYAEAFTISESDDWVSWVETET
jgi:hypothetical protein